METSLLPIHKRLRSVEGGPVNIIVFFSLKKFRESSCAMMNSSYENVTIYGHILIFTGILPISITVLFGLLDYRNVQNLNSNTTN